MFVLVAEFLNKYNTLAPFQWPLIHMNSTKKIKYTQFVIYFEQHCLNESFVWLTNKRIRFQFRYIARNIVAVIRLTMP